ncbi:unnamed protein product [Lactuca virosa]|uniref:Uncharacterized protein n=1 Tax=Lactuca virosa TaxID=75947 RepID=A0AAU9PF59_9ASTR|nr:unnamed protein product [Lactuca virosa]
MKSHKLSQTPPRKAVDLICGELIDINISGFGNDDLLDYIFLRSSKLKRLCLTYLCGRGSWLTRAAKRFPQLEELHISLGSMRAEDIEVIGRNCPWLKSFTVNKVFDWSQNDGDALAIANYMPELRHLDFCGSDMTNDGLKAILIGCPHLESLELRMCSNLNLEGNLGKFCTQRIKDFMM